ncbi:hypothetical protein [Pseudoclavibacter helvolus]|uniref:WXG100 family type VII secretion target n=1 Tax=Pseudoclavibacter helvolus TaxID=255205 RepID=UPI003D157621
MGEMIGADVEQLRLLAKQFETAASKLENDRRIVTSVIGGLVRPRGWAGQDAAGFRSAWQSEYSPQLRRAAEALRASGDQLRRNAAQQEKASAADEAGSASRRGGSAYAPYPPSTGIEVTAGNVHPDEIPRGAWHPHELISEFGRDGVYDSAVTIRTVVDADGNKSHILYIPGTQDWLGLGGNAFNGADNIGAVFGSSNKLESAIHEALRKHGVSKDEPLMIVGHSQGGLVAGNMAADSTFRSNYNLESVLVFGASIQSREIPSSVAVTQVVNILEPVPVASNVGGDGSRIENFNKIVFSYANIQTAGGLFRWPSGWFGFQEHNDFQAYGSNTFDWYNQHKDEWREQHSSFQTDHASTSSATKYEFRE